VRTACQDFYLERGRLQSAVPRFRLRSWKEYPEVDRLRRAWCGSLEGLHATLGEVAIVMAAEPRQGAHARLEGAAQAADAARDLPTFEAEP